MIDADKILKEGAERRERTANRRKLLDDLRRSTRRNVGTALVVLPIAVLFLWSVCSDFLISDDPVTKGDIGEILIYGYLIFSLLKLGFDSLRPNRRDLFLIDLLEEKLKDEEGV